MSSSIKKQILEKYSYNKEQISFLCHSSKAYSPHYINKKNGGKRTIMVPCESLKELQQSVLKYLKDYNITNKYLSYQFAYSKGKNNIDFAKAHVNRKYIFKYDIKNYFGQITFPRIVGTLKKNEFSPEDAVFIAQLSCNRSYGIHESLAQGAPLSPFLSNLVSTPVDSFFINYSKKYNDVVYSRYADDICLSTNDYMTYKYIKKDYSHIYQALRNKNFILNDEKYRIYRKGRKIIGGLKINSRLNLKREYIDSLKLNLFFAKKDYFRTVNDYCKIHNNKIKTKDLSPFYEQCIRGKILYLSNVRGRDDNLVINLKKKYNSIPEFIHKFDERQLYEKSIFLLKYGIEKAKGKDYESRGTIFKVKTGLITCYHNFFDFEHDEYFFHDYKICARNLEDKMATYDLKINTNEIKQDVNKYEIINGVIINEQYDFVFLSNSFLLKNMNNFLEFEKLSVGLDVEVNFDKYNENDAFSVKCYGYSHLNEINPRLNIKETKAINNNQLNRIYLDDYLGKGASGGPILSDDKVVAVYNKGTYYEEDSQGVSLNRFLNEIKKDTK